ncbi:hypothetical protein HanIR_Chr01g0048991 [Helianthus annuus]|nr:hypothetical protein HanIR_Chr01g0048991 [Helianthus annuus]
MNTVALERQKWSVYKRRLQGLDSSSNIYYGDQGLLLCLSAFTLSSLLLSSEHPRPPLTSSPSLCIFVVTTALTTCGKPAHCRSTRIYNMHDEGLPGCASPEI